MSDVTSHILLDTPTAHVRDVCCLGTCRHKSETEYASSTHIVFPYRGLYVRHVGSDDAVADANQVLFFNGDQEYQISHPVTGGDACLSIGIDEAHLTELAHGALLPEKTKPTFPMQRARIDSRAQVLVALLRHALRSGMAEPLEAETLTLTLVRRALGLQARDATRVTPGRRKLVDRVKLVLAGDPTRRWRLADIAAETGGSPVYLTQVFQQVEGMPLYKYQMQLRLARSLDLIDRYDDLTALGLDLGFSSHSHFTATFRQAFGRTPSEFKQTSIQRPAV